MYKTLKLKLLVIVLLSVLVNSTRLHRRLLKESELNERRRLSEGRGHAHGHRKVKKKVHHHETDFEDDFWSSGDSLFDMLENMEDTKDSVIFTTTEGNNLDFKKLAAKYMMIDPEYT